MTILLPLDLRYVRPVALALREADRAEIFATRRSEDLERLALDACAFSRFGAVAATEAGTPAAALGAVEQWDGVWTVWMFATAGWPSVALGATRYVRRELIPQLVAAGAHRAECKSLASHSAAHDWLKLLGARLEATHPNYGRNGETFHTFAWRLEDVLFLHAGSGGRSSGPERQLDGRPGGG